MLIITHGVTVRLTRKANVSNDDLARIAVATIDIDIAALIHANIVRVVGNALAAQVKVVTCDLVVTEQSFVTGRPPAGE